MTDILDQVRVFLAEAKGISAGDLPSTDSSLLVSGILDSVMMVEMVTFLESSFQISIGDEDLMPDNFETLGSIAAFVELKQRRDTV